MKKLEEIKTAQEYNEYVNQVKMQAFVRLVEIRKLIQELQKEEEQIKDWALDYVRDVLMRDEKSADFDVNGIKVNVTINYRKIFQYPEEILKLENELKQKKKLAELDGSAKLLTLNPYLVLKF
ncbi:hypothetical protein JGI7_01865 [Candidatus Kryptonium thompsonii]|uniref:Uncharacterized protein n=2 Tax=Candidatus Kryptonium thompsonii TaxID=1633631 RepID=A0A0P1MAJ5_9BACT|nr:hypothetical protein [Candidatus Kryptonium thompsoni]CUS81619.1 hypothetical protein JGI10_00666 [Candidatus Kryptonium thompsoni]CUS86007.1 hypothetical protein JGI8_00955 [Candidatus Kryptonium thompsoni]CUS91133.1 hypothetical protein JGI16_11931 [Candidatus Kryptonium thompsoni]CUS91702.1 hypothetical protein JGI6_00274 [Candidatus Kryptonium thompsoni]CUS93719.1 hypothetical protein JGI7_01865 [Candidatus Kryptonium thompsoni]